MKILVITEQRQGKWNNTSFETLVAAQQIAAEPACKSARWSMGKGVANFAEDGGKKYRGSSSGGTRPARSLHA